MITITTLDGEKVDVDVKSILLIAGPYPHDVGPHTYVYGPSPGVLVTAEQAADLVARLRLKPPLVQLTRPNNTPVWLKGSAVTTVRAPVPAERSKTGTIHAVVLLGKLRQAIREDVATAIAEIKKGGGTV
jgi:hypothetical protein